MFVVSTALSYVGWWIGETVGVMTAFLVSAAGGILGLYLGYKLARRIED